MAVGSPLVTRVSGAVAVLDPSPRGLVRKLSLLENPCGIRLVSGKWKVFDLVAIYHWFVPWSRVFCILWGPTIVGFGIRIALGRFYTRTTSKNCNFMPST